MSVALPNYPHAKEDVRAELVIYMHNNLFNYNTRYLKNSSIPHPDWESAGIFPTIHDALVAGKEWLEEAKEAGFRRGSLTNPWMDA